MEYKTEKYLEYILDTLDGIKELMETTFLYYNQDCEIHESRDYGIQIKDNNQKIGRKVSVDKVVEILSNI